MFAEVLQGKLYGDKHISLFWPSLIDIGKKKIMESTVTTSTFQYKKETRKALNVLNYTKKSYNLEPTQKSLCGHLFLLLDSVTSY